MLNQAKNVLVQVVRSHKGPYTFKKNIEPKNIHTAWTSTNKSLTNSQPYIF